MGKYKVGKLIVLEGIDGAGKTTIGRFLCEQLDLRKIPCSFTREPTDGKYGRQLRERIRRGDLSPEEELYLFVKDRKEHVENFILPEKNKGKIVVCDRYYISNCAYQGARGMDPKKILELNSTFPPPDLIVFLDIEPEMALRRKHELFTHFENREFLEKVREIYLKILPMFRFVNINASFPLEKVKSLTLKAVERFIYEG